MYKCAIILRTLSLHSSAPILSRSWYLAKKVNRLNYAHMCIAVCVNLIKKGTSRRFCQKKKFKIEFQCKNLPFLHRFVLNINRFIAVCLKLVFPTLHCLVAHHQQCLYAHIWLYFLCQFFFEYLINVLICISFYINF